MKGLTSNHKINGRQIASFHHRGKPTLEFHKDLFRDSFSTYSYMIQRRVNSEMTFFFADNMHFQTSKKVYKFFHQ